MKTKKLRWVVYAILATILLIPNLVEGAEKVQCRLKFEKNKSYYIRITTDTQVTMEVTRQGTGKQEVLEHSVFAFGYEVDVDEIDAEGNAWIKVLYDQVSFSQKTPQTEVRYDSSKKYHKIALSAKGFAALVGQRFYLKITPQGRIEKINGLPAMRSYVKINLPGRVTEAQRTLMLEGMKEQLDEEAVKESFETFMAIYPDRVVDVNDSWEETIILSQSPAMVLEKTSKLKKRRNGIAFIETNSNIRPNLEAEPLQMGNVKMIYELSGQEHGQIEMQEWTGRIIRSKFERVVSGQVKTEVLGKPGQRISPTKIQSTVTFEMDERYKEQEY